MEWICEFCGIELDQWGRNFDGTDHACYEDEVRDYEDRNL